MPPPQNPQNPIDLSAGVIPAKPPIDLSAGIVPPARPATVSAAPPSQHPVQDWLHNLETDVTEGGNRTLPGRLLGHMQGRGDEGYAGVNAGVGPGPGKIMGSPLLGPIHAAEGAAETPQHPLMGPLKAVDGVLEAGTIPGMMMGGEGIEGAANLLERIPTRAHAAGVFNEIEDAARNLPVRMENTAPALQDFRGSVATGGKNAPVMTKLLRRLEPPAPRTSLLANMQAELNGLPTGAPPPQPLLFPEARDFYTNISRATAKPGFLRGAIENPAMPAFRREAGNVREALNSDLTAAADTIGRGQDYADAGTEYRRAAQLNKGLKTAGKIGAGAALTGAGLAHNPIIQYIKAAQ